jgi:cold shock protein
LQPTNKGSPEVFTTNVKTYDFTEPTESRDVPFFGTVKFFNAQKGYGFIVLDDTSSQDVFIHANELARSGIRSLNSGDRLSFDVETFRDGKRRATSIELLQ